MVKKALLTAILLAAVLCSLAAQTQDSSSEQTEPKMTVELSPNPVGRGDRFSVTIEVPNPGFSDVEVEAPELDESIGILRGPYIRPFYEYPEEGDRIEKSRITYVYAPRETGRFEIGSYRIETKEQVFRTEPRLLEAGVYHRREIVVPPQLQWRVPKKEVYVGENLSCILEVAGEPEIAIFENIAVEKPAEGFFERAPELGEIKRESRAGVPLYTIPVDGYLFTPSAPGEVRIPAASLTKEGVSSRTGEIVIEVSPLPQVLKDSGAIGNFSLTASVDREELSEGQELHLRVRIEGTGNLNYLRLPDPRAEGFRVLGEEEQSQMEPSAEGFRGYREVTYTLLAEEAGSEVLSVPRMAVMRPEAGTVYRLGGEQFTLNVESVAGAGEQAGGEKEFPFSLKELSEMSRMDDTSRYTMPLNYLWLLPGPLTFLLFLLLRRKKLGVLTLSFVCFLSFAAPPPEDAEHFSRGVEAYEQGSYSDAMVQFELALEEYPYYPDLYYNAALAAYKNGDIGKAVYFGREAVYLSPGKSDYTRLLSYIEEENEFGRRVPLPFPIHPDLLFLTLTITINAAGFVGVVYLYKRRNMLFIAANLFLVVTLAAGIALGVAAHSRSNRAGVVMWRDTSAQVIPRIESPPAFPLTEGQTVLIIGKSAPFYFVENSLGQKGWLLEHQLRVVGKPGSRSSLTLPAELRQTFPLPKDTGSGKTEETE